MDRRAVEAPGEELERVARVDDERAGDVAHPAPGAPACACACGAGEEDLQGGDGLGVEEGDGAEVGVALEPDLGRLEFLFLRSGVAVRRSGREF